jgi:hypothetical protein
VNRGNFWVQGRPLVAYWGGPQRPARYIQARLIKDNYDFSSGLLYTVQDRGWLLGLVNFQTDGGDKHPSLDRVKNGEFTASRFRLRFDIAGLGSKPQLVSPPGGHVGINLGDANVCLQIRKAAMGAFEPKLTFGFEGKAYVISVDWFTPGEPRTIRWKETGPAYAIFTMAMSGPEMSLDELGRSFAQRDYSAKMEDPGVQVKWGNLALGGHILPGPLSEQDRAFTAEIDGKPVPQVRLSDARLTRSVLQ